MENGIVLVFAGMIVAIGGIVKTVPMIFPCRGTFLKDIMAFGAKDIIAKAEVFMKNQCPLRNPLLTVLALHIPSLMNFFGTRFLFAIVNGDPQTVMHGQTLWLRRRSVFERRIEIYGYIDSLCVLQSHIGGT